MILTYRIDQIPTKDRAAWLTWGERHGNLLTIDTADPRYGQRPPEHIPDDFDPEARELLADQSAAIGGVRSGRR